MNHSHYSFFPGDYMRDTMHLGWLEDCAYRRLLDLYYSRAMPIRNDRAYIMRAIRASEPEQQAAADVVLSEFFVLQADGWHNAKADRELAHYCTTSEKRKRAGEISAENRRKRAELLASLENNVLSSANAQQVHNTCSAPTPTPTPTPTPISTTMGVKTKAPTAEKERGAEGATLPDWVPADVWRGFREHRVSLRKRMTARAEVLLLRDLEKIVQTTGADPAEIIEQSIKNGWTGIFELKRTSGNGNGQQHSSSAAEREAARRRAVVDKLCGREGREGGEKIVHDL